MTLKMLHIKITPSELIRIANDYLEVEKQLLREGNSPLASSSVRPTIEDENILISIKWLPEYDSEKKLINP